MIRKIKIMLLCLLFLACASVSNHEIAPTLPIRSVHHDQKTQPWDVVSIPIKQKPPTSLPSIYYPSCLHEIGQRYGQKWGSVIEQGTDFDCSFRTPLSALWSGTVLYAARTCWNSACSSTSGCVVVIDSDVMSIGLQSVYYLHLDSFVVSRGIHINKGDIIGYTGGQVGYGNCMVSPWFSSGPHVEIGFCASFLPCDRGYNRDPLPYIERAIV